MPYFADIKPANILTVVDEEAIRHAVSEPVDVSVGTAPDSREITRVRSRGIPYPLPESDLNSGAAWKNTRIKLADVGVCMYDTLALYQ